MASNGWWDDRVGGWMVGGVIFVLVFIYYFIFINNLKKDCFVLLLYYSVKILCQGI